VGFLKEKLRARIATRGDVVILQADLRKLRRRVDGFPDLKDLIQRVRRLTKQIGAQDAILAKQKDALAKQNSTLSKQSGTQAQQGSTLSKQAAEIRALQHGLRVLTADYERMAKQLAATETRLEWLRKRVDPEIFEGTSDEHAAARNLIDEVRREHDQIRVRFQVVSNYEERLSRVETILLAAPKDFAE
jgi:septal ring factor EnvC (AmiA/AmiB activator)